MSVCLGTAIPKSGDLQQGWQVWKSDSRPAAEDSGGKAPV